jgi:mannose-6-phosphate isomerase-like protein (cupin superfamily)
MIVVMFQTQDLPEDGDTIAPDGSTVRLLPGLSGGGLAHFQLDPGAVSVPVHHRTVEEIWYVVAGRGRMWRRLGDREETVELGPGVSLTIPLGTRFQFRAGSEGLSAIGVTMPPWPGDGEAVRTTGPWTPTLSPGPGLTAES